MIPLYLDPNQARIALIGRGALAVRRLEWLRAGGAVPDVWSDAPSSDLLVAAQGLQRCLPPPADIEAYHAIWIADLDRDEADRLACLARAAGVLVNVEDVPTLCDFHTPAVVRRGRLTLAAATGGASPAVARMVRERLETTFPGAWGDVLDEIAQSRTELRERGAGIDDLIADARARLISRHLV